MNHSLCDCIWSSRSRMFEYWHWLTISSCWLWLIIDLVNVFVILAIKILYTASLYWDLCIFCIGLLRVWSTSIADICSLSSSVRFVKKTLGVQGAEGVGCVLGSPGNFWVHSGGFSYTNSKVLFAIKCRERYVIIVFLAIDGDTDITRGSAIAERPRCRVHYFWPKVEEWNSETIFHWHYTSVFNHCDVIGSKGSR